MASTSADWVDVDVVAIVVAAVFVVVAVVIQSWPLLAAGRCCDVVSRGGRERKRGHREDRRKTARTDQGCDGRRKLMSKTRPSQSQSQWYGYCLVPLFDVFDGGDVMWEDWDQDQSVDVGGVRGRFHPFAVVRGLWGGR